MSNRPSNSIDQEPAVAPEKRKDRVAPMELNKLEEVAPCEQKKQEAVDPKEHEAGHDNCRRIGIRYLQKTQEGKREKTQDTVRRSRKEETAPTRKPARPTESEPKSLTMNDSELNQEVNDLIDFKDDGSNSSETRHAEQEEEHPPVAPLTPGITIEKESAPIGTAKAAKGNSDAAAVTPGTSTPATGARRKKETIATEEVPAKKPRQDQEEMYKLINKRIRSIEKEIEHGKKAHLLMQRMEKSLEELQTTFKTELRKHGAGLHADLKKGFEENRSTHQRAGHEIHATNRKVDGLVTDSAVVKADLTRIKVLVEDSRQLWLTKMTGNPKPDHYSSPVATKEGSSSHWSTPYYDPIQEIQPIKENVNPAPKPYPPHEVCAFCGGFSHQSEACKKRPSWRTRRQIVFNKGKCSFCLQKHQEGEICPRDGEACETCSSLYPLDAAKALHHPALCDNLYLGAPIESSDRIEPSIRMDRSSRGRAPRRGRGRERGRGIHHGKHQ
ncbi:Protein CBG08919 [Caenorhabditis briggsae]|uniref:Uncharacterized protein n=2 Tax=Caenorhabditis briggsae TaxID=6238 RepID=A0AAE9CX10_CAEBR|nr:Protein CBG08919 [Caenorhabditis briggsae]ULT85226.1 hypothetical protein L3Y34_013769 [Caenorhabditis briggsae]CAP28656.1 Protein CBG08919 [Caenorhabditis briggsae]